MSRNPSLLSMLKGGLVRMSYMVALPPLLLSMMVCSLSYLTGVEPKSRISGICISILDPWQITGSMNFSRSV